MRTKFRQGAGRSAFLSLAAALAGGSTFTSCDTKVKVAVMDGVKDTFLSLFDPTNFLDTGSADGTGTGTGGLSDQ